MFIITLLLAACGEGSVSVDGSNPGHNTDGNVGGETVSGVEISASNGEYIFDDNGSPVLANTQNEVPGVTLDVLDSNGNPVTIKDEDGNVLTETVAIVANLKPDSYTALFDYVSDDGIPMIGQTTTTVSKVDLEIETTLCDDLSGNWHFVSDSGATIHDSPGVTMDGCGTQMEGIASGDEVAIVVYNYLSYRSSSAGTDAIYDRTSDTIRAHDIVYDVWFTGTRE